jgi:hypothetical protein
MIKVKHMWKVEFFGRRIGAIGNPEQTQIYLDCKAEEINPKIYEKYENVSFIVCSDMNRCNVCHTILTEEFGRDYCTRCKRSR